MIASSLLAFIFAKTGCPLEVTWRVLLGVGALPALTALIVRMRMHESTAFEEAHQVDKSASSISELWNRFKASLVMYGRMILVTSMAWLLLDVTFYGTGQFKHVIGESFVNSQVPSYQRDWNATVVLTTTMVTPPVGLSTPTPITVPSSTTITTEVTQQSPAARLTTQPLPEQSSAIVGSSQATTVSPPVETSTPGSGTDSVANERVAAQGLFGVIVGCMGLPGYLVAAALLARGFNPWRLQIVGFVALILTYMASGLLELFSVSATAELLVFGFSFFIANLGPNTTTFVMPSTVYDPSVLATAHGISAAAGKIGAVLGATLFGTYGDTHLPQVLFACGGIACWGLAVTAWGAREAVRLKDYFQAIDSAADDAENPLPASHRASHDT